MQFKRLQTKIAVWAGACLLVSTTAIVLYAGLEMRRQALSAREKAIQHAKQYAGSVAQHRATEIQVWLEVALDAARTLAHTFSGIRDKSVGLYIGRIEVNGILKTVLAHNPDFVGVSTAWEENAFDNMDQSYMGYDGHDASGRFIPYWNRNANGDITLEALVDYEIEGAGDYYLLPKKTKNECIIDPYLYTIQEEEVLMTSLVAPILTNKVFRGIIGVDLRLDRFQPLVDNAQNLYEGSAEMFIFSHDGTLVAATGRPELRGKSIQDIHSDWQEDLGYIQSGKLVVEEDEGRIAVFAPLQIGRTTTPWSVNILIPMDAITAEADAQKAQALQGVFSMIVVSIICTITALSLLWMMAGNIATPIQQSAHFATQLAAGDLNAELLILQHDELGILADALRMMREKLNEVLFDTGSLIQSVQKGKLKARGNADAYSGSWQELIHGINSLVDAFQRPFQKTAGHLQQLAEGSIPDIIDEKYQGDFDDVRQNLNRCIESISGLTEETKTLTQAAIQGRLDARGYAQKFGGEYADIVNGINNTIGTLVGHLNRIPVPITIIDSHFKLLFINDAGAELLGSSKEQLQGKKCYDLLKSDHCHTQDCICARAMNSLESEYGETDIRPSGKHLSVSHCSAPLLSQDGNAIGALEILMDQSDIKQAMAAVQQQNWMRSGQAELSKVMRGEQGTTALAKNLIGFLVRYFQADIGAIYLTHGANGDSTLRLAGSHAYKRRKVGEDVVKFGQGFVGQAALEHESIIYSDIPKEYLTIKIENAYEAPHQMLVSPFRHDDQLKGVIEIGTRNSFTNAHLDFLKQASESIAVAFHSAETRVKMQELLEHSQQQAEELQAQTEELQAQTEEFQAQQDEISRRTTQCD